MPRAILRLVTHYQPKGADMAAKEITKETLEKAAKMRDEGATWNQIREVTGT